MIDSYMIMMKKIKLEDFNRNLLEFDVKYGRVGNNGNDLIENNGNYINNINNILDING